jgi:uncharacterized repeat protein (TIGR01451 family)
MSTLKKLFYLMIVLFGLNTQLQAQCQLNVTIFPDTSSCPVNTLYAFVSGGSQPYFYTWSNGASTSFVQGIQPGVYSVTVTSALGCVGTASYTVVNTAPLQLSGNATPESCGNRNGAINITVIGGSGNFQYSWYLGNTFIGNTQDIDSLQAGFYQVYISDLVNGCFTQGSFQVANNGGGAVTTNSTPESCTQGNGTATAVITGFTNPTYLWNNGGTTATITGLSTGYYGVTVSDANCSSSAYVYVGNTSNFWLYLWGMGCPVDSLQAYISGGQAPYTYLWSTGSSTVTQNQLQYLTTNGPGNYSLTVTDASGCTQVASYNIGTPITATYTVQNASCAGNDGAINVTASGGTGSLFYYWSNGAQTEDLSGLNAGIYNLSILDSSQCSYNIDSIVVGGGGNLTIQPIINSANCADSLGSIYLTYGGTPFPFTFLWNNGATTHYQNNLGSGWYGVTITSSNGCTYTNNYYVPTNPICFVRIAGYVYNVSLSNTCNANGAAAVPFAMVRLQPSGQIGFTNALGYYEFNGLAPGNYSVEFVNNGGTFSLLCPTNNSIAVNNTVNGTLYNNNNFYITSPLSQDLRINLSHYSTVTPGFGYWTVIHFCNDGQMPMSGTIEYTYDNDIDFDAIWSMSSTGSPVFTGHNTTTNLLSFSFSNLQPGQCGYIYVDFNTPTTLPLGTLVSNSATIYPLNNDATPANNTDIDNTTCVGSWDPNEKLAQPVRSGTEREGGNIYTTDEVIDYTIHFQNLGTAPAYRVVIKDELEANLLIETIRNVQMSHNGILTIENGNELVITFYNIMLPAASFDYHGSNGYVKFTINRQSGLPVGTEINNDAAIYFDFNAPVITNTNTLTISEVTSVSSLETNISNSNVYPNPFQTQLTLSYELEKETELTIELFDALGTRIRNIQNGVSEMPGSHVHEINVSDLAPSVYFLTISSGEDRKIYKVVKR